MVPVVPIVANVLSLGIPFIIDLVNRGKGKREARKASAKAADAIANIQLGAGAVAGALDAGVGQIGLTPEDINALPEWLQVAYVASICVGVVVKFMAQRMKRLADNTPEE